MLMPGIEYEMLSGMPLEQLARRHRSEHGLPVAARLRPGQRREDRQILLMTFAHHSELHLALRRRRRAAVGRNRRRWAVRLQHDDDLRVEHPEQKIRPVRRIGYGADQATL